MNRSSRREWLRQSSLAVAGITIAGQLLGKPGSGRGWFDEDSEDLIRIGSNENPYGPSPMAREAMIRAVGSSNRYPWEVTTQLREKIGKIYGLDQRHVLMGAGSSELLGVTAAYAARNRGNAIAAYPTFRLWFTAAEHFGLQVKSIPCTADKKHDLDAMMAAMDAETRMVYIVNPHNPTGTVVGRDKLEAAIRTMTAKCLVLLDEAYTEYSDEPSLGNLVANNRNLVVAKTFSKIYGLAGARAGYVLAHPDTIEGLSAYMPWANAGTSAVSLAGAMASLDDLDFVRSTRQKTDAVREMLTSEFARLNIPLIRSHTSFIYYDSSPLKSDVAKACEAAKIQGVRSFEQGTGWRRTSIGTMAEMEKFVSVLKKLRQA